MIQLTYIQIITYFDDRNRIRGIIEFIAGATETKGSWWPDWLVWLSERAPGKVAANGARIPGDGTYKAIEDAPGSYVKTR